MRRLRIQSSLQKKQLKRLCHLIFYCNMKENQAEMWDFFVLYHVHIDIYSHCILNNVMYNCVVTKLPTLRYFLLQNCLGKTWHFSTGFSLGVSFVIYLSDIYLYMLYLWCLLNSPAGLDRLDITELLGNPGDGDLLLLMAFLLLLLVTTPCSTQGPGYSGTLGDPQRAAGRAD